jgi:hypothetical protein
MADSKITALTALTAADPANDMIPIVDVSDTPPASGNTKRISINNILACSPSATLASLNVTGSSIPANGLYLPTTNTLEFSANSLAQYRIAPLGVFSWYDGAGGTRMTLNSTGLGVGGSPITKFFVQDATLTGSSQIREQVIRAASDNTNNSFNSLVGFTFSAASAAYSAGSLVRSSGVYGINLDNTAFGRVMGLSFYTCAQDAAATEKMRIDSSGNVGVGVTPSGSGGCLQLKSGITFPATQVASSDANTLDDYEEGTWTGTLKGSVSDPTVPVTATGRYTKIGRQVYVQINFANVSTVGASGEVQISGLPFANNASVVSQGTIVSDQTLTFTGSPYCWVDLSGTTIRHFAFVSNGAAGAANHNAGVARYLYSNLTYTV